MVQAAQPVAPLVGRVGELDTLAHAVAALGDGSGGMLALVGPAGVGKSRLAREAVRLARDAGVLVLTGRAVALGTPTPYRPLAEALAPVARERPVVGLDALAQGSSPESPESPVSPVHVAESVLRALPGPQAPVLLLQEDLHWADEETLAALEYLADAAESLPLLVVVTARDEEGETSRRWLRSLAARGAARPVPLGPLDLAETRRLASLALGEPASESLARLLVERADGLPLFVEELIGALRSAGALAGSAEGVDVTAVAGTVLPATIGDAVAARLDALSEEDRTVLEAAALLGRFFEHARVAGIGGARTDPALRAAMAVALVEEDPDRPGQLRYRHALLRDGVLAAAYPPRRAALAGRLLEALLEDDPRGEDLAVAVELAARAGQSTAAARLALRHAYEALNRWALSSSERSLAQARHHAGDDPELLVDIDVLQMRVSSIAGRFDVAERVARALLTRTEATDRDDVRLDAHLRLAHTLLDDERWEEASDHLDAASALLPAGDHCSVVRWEVDAAVAARYAGRSAEAREGSVRAAALGRPHDDTLDLVCAALLNEARAWLPDVATARARLDEGLRFADAHDLWLWRGRLLTELAVLAADDLGGDEELHEAEERAHEAGAVELMVRSWLLQARLAVLRGQLDDADALLERATGTGALMAPMARLADEVRDALDAVRHGRGDSALAALARDDVAAATGAVRPGGHWFSVVDDLVASDPGPGAVGEARALLPDVSAAVTRLQSSPLLAALATRVWAEHGDPAVPTVSSAIEILERFGLDRPAEACRSLLRRQGVPLPRRTAAQDGVPDQLRAAGVTLREYDVLQLLATGATNREIAERLYLSPRTVEKHVERLLLKAGASNRTALAGLVADVT